MIKRFKDISLKFKLIACFLLIILINSISGFMSVNLMKQLGEMVNITYDKALMSATFAQAVKFDFSQYDSEVKSALLSDNLADFEKHIAKSTRAYNTLQDDIKIVDERALDGKHDQIISQIHDQMSDFEKIKNETIAKKKALFSQKDVVDDSVDLVKSWDANRLRLSIYRKITSLYDNAAEIGYHFRLSSESTNVKNLNRTFWILISCIVISLVLSFIVSYFIIAPLLKLQDVCKVVEEGDYAVRADATAKDELGKLGNSFNSMLNTIQDKTENISSLLSSLPFGLFYFDQNGIISKERSHSTDIIFKNFAQYTTLSDFFASHKCNTRQIKTILDAIFKNLIPFDSAVMLFPDTLEIQENNEIKKIHISFKPKFNTKGKVERVILLAEDITDKEKAKEESRELTERVIRVSNVSADIVGFKEFLPEVKKLYTLIIRQLESGDAALEADVKRNLHSLKGLLGIYSFSSCASGIHELEGFIQENFITKATYAIKLAQKSEIIFIKQTQDIVDLLALNTENGLKFYDVNKIKFIKDLALKAHDPVMVKATLDLDKFPIEKVLTKYSIYAQKIANKLEDKKVKVVFEESDEISYEEVQRLDAVLIHVLNNSIDHGIESASERSEFHKNETGEIRISCRRNLDQSLEFRISDDGRGINGKHLFEKAVKIGLMSVEQVNTVSEQEKLNLIFASGFSTKDEASQISGRGVGMDAVKTYLESLGGSIELFTQLGSGTTFELKVPALNVI